MLRGFSEKGVLTFFTEQYRERFNIPYDIAWRKVKRMTNLFRPFFVEEIKKAIRDSFRFLLSDINKGTNEASMVSKRFKILASELNRVVFLCRLNFDSVTKSVTEFEEV